MEGGLDRRSSWVLTLISLWLVLRRREKMGMKDDYVVVVNRDRYGKEPPLLSRLPVLPDTLEANHVTATRTALEGKE